MATLKQEYEIWKANTGSTKSFAEFKRLIAKSDKYKAQRPYRYCQGTAHSAQLNQMEGTVSKQQSAEDVAKYIRDAISSISEAIAIMEYDGLNLENYPEYWRDFEEHPTELGDMIVTDFEDIQVQVNH